MVCINPTWANLTTNRTNKLNLKTGHLTLKGTPKISFKSQKKDFPVKCGKCIGCRLDHACEVATRCHMEALEHETNSFVTLTYNQQNLPIGPKGHPTLCKPDPQGFLKRLRYYYPNADIRYIIAGEYGPKTLRPHYHLALFGYKPTDLKEYKKNKQGDMTYTSEELEKIWGKGFVVIGNLTQQSGSYIARYVTKKILQPYFEIPGTTNEYIIYSKRPAVGLTNWEKHKEEYIKNGGIYIKIKDKARLFPIPTLFQRKRQEEVYQEWGISKADVPEFDITNNGKEIHNFLKKADFLFDAILEEPYYAEKRNNISKAQERMNELLKQTDLKYTDYLKIIENKLIQNAKLLRRDQI